MCRMILAIGTVNSDTVLETAVAMSEGVTSACAAPTKKHPNGWGLLYREVTAGSGKFTVHKSTLPIGQSYTEFELPVQPTLMVVHTRHATLDCNQGLSFTHPLSDADQQWFLFHNGFLPSIHREVGLPSSSFDTREYFLFLRPHLSEQRDVLRCLDRLEQLGPENTSGNAFLIGSNCAYIITWFHRDSAFPEFYTMWTAESAGVKYFSSERIPWLAAEKQWRPLPRVSVQQIKF